MSIKYLPSELAAIIAAVRAEGLQAYSLPKQEEVERLKAKVKRLENEVRHEGEHQRKCADEWFRRAQAAEAKVKELEAEIVRLEEQLAEHKRRCKELQVEHDGLRRSEREWRKKVIAAENNLK